MTSLFDVMRKGGADKVLSVGVPDSAFTTRSPDADGRRVRTNSDLKEYSKGTSFVKYVECPVSYQRGDEYEPDGLHFAPRTSEALAERLAPVVKDLVAP